MEARSQASLHNPYVHVHQPASYPSIASSVGGEAADPDNPHSNRSLTRIDAVPSGASNLLYHGSQNGLDPKSLNASHVSVNPKSSGNVMQHESEPEHVASAYLVHDSEKNSAAGFRADAHEAPGHHKSGVQMASGLYKAPNDAMENHILPRHDTGSRPQFSVLSHSTKNVAEHPQLSVREKDPGHGEISTIPSRQALHETHSKLHFEKPADSGKTAPVQATHPHKELHATASTTHLENMQGEPKSHYGVHQPTAPTAGNLGEQNPHFIDHAQSLHEPCYGKHCQMPLSATHQPAHRPVASNMSHYQNPHHIDNVQSAYQACYGPSCRIPPPNMAPQYHPSEVAGYVSDEPEKAEEAKPRGRSARMSVVESTPAKRMVLLNNGDKLHRGVPYVLNEKKVRNWDILLRDWTDRVKPSFGPVRRVFTPVGGTEITEMADLRPNAVYVLSGFEKMKPIPEGYKVADSMLETHFNHNFAKKKNAARARKSIVPEKTLPVYLSGDFIPDRRENMPSVLTINVHKNGDDINPPTKVTLKKFDLWNITRAKDAISERVKPLGGVVRSIHTPDGTPVEHVVELQANGYYVVVGPFERFQPVAYEPNGRHEVFFPMSAKHPSIYQRDTAGRAEVTAKRRRTFVVRLKKKNANSVEREAKPADDYMGNSMPEEPQEHFRPVPHAAKDTHQHISLNMPNHAYEGAGWIPAHEVEVHQHDTHPTRPSAHQNYSAVLVHQPPSSHSAGAQPRAMQVDVQSASQASMQEEAQRRAHGGMEPIQSRSNLIAPASQLGVQKSNVVLLSPQHSKLRVAGSNRSIKQPSEQAISGSAAQLQVEGASSQVSVYETGSSNPIRVCQSTEQPSTTSVALCRVESAIPPSAHASANRLSVPSTTALPMASTTSVKQTPDDVGSRMSFHPAPSALSVIPQESTQLSDLFEEELPRSESFAHRESAHAVRENMSKTIGEAGHDEDVHEELVRRFSVANHDEVGPDSELEEGPEHEPEAAAQPSEVLTPSKDEKKPKRKSKLGCC